MTMTTFRERRSTFDAAVASYQAGDKVGAGAAFARLTADDPEMSDSWLGRLACGDHHLDTLAGAHEHSEALHRETSRVGLKDGELSAEIAAPMYLMLTARSRATIGLAYASKLIIAGRYDEAAVLLDDPILMEDREVAPYRQFVMAALFHQTRSWSNVLKVAELSPSGDAAIPEDVTSAVAALAATAAANLGQFQLALDLCEQVSAANPQMAADVARTRAWCQREVGDDHAATTALSAPPVAADVEVANGTPEPASSSPQPPQPKYWHPYDDGRDLLVARRRPATGGGWRALVNRMTLGRVNPEPSAKSEQTNELVRRICAPLSDVHKVAVVSAKGGVGKTTLTVALGNAVARLRGDRVIAVDVDADLGDLSARFNERGGPRTNIENLVLLENAKRYADVRVHTLMNRDRLEMLGAQNDPRSTYRLGAEDYEAATKILENHFNVMFLDCGTSIGAPLFGRICDTVTGLVVVASDDVRGVEGTLATLDWLDSHGHARLLQHTVVVLNSIRKTKAFVDLEAVENQFRKRVPDFFRLPYDTHLATGLAVEFTSLKRGTRKALLDLAGGVAKHYPVIRAARPGGEQALGTWIESIRQPAITAS
jgi:MinD-like ATPase involved in chromosome partitioning or flagellar assembly